MTTPEETLEGIKRTLDWHIEALTCKDQTIRSITDVYDLGWHIEVIETLKKKYFKE